MRARETDEGQPEVLGLALANLVISEEVASDRDLRVGHCVARPQKRDEELDHGRFGVDEVQFVSRTRPLCPEQHATRNVDEVTVFRLGSSSCLSLPPPLQRSDGVGPRTVDPPSHPPAKSLTLLARQLDVSDPETDRGRRNTKEPCELLDRTALLTTEPSSLFSLGCFHD